MGKSFYIITAITVVVILGLVGFIFKDQLFGVDNDSQRIVPVIATLSDNEFSLKADHYDSMGIHPGTSFTLTAQNQVEKASIEGNLKVEPDFSYKIESSDSNQFSIVPEETLKDNTIYKFSMVGQQAGDDSVKEYQWAYQTKSIFKVMGTLPADKATYVPIASGIEINFSHENFDNIEDYFTISPDVAGSFEKHRKTLVFVPESLAESTLYTVTVKQGLPIHGSDLVLEENYVFQFETESTNYNSGHVSFSDNFFEYPSTQQPIMTINEYESGLTSLNVEVFGFDSFEDFTTAVDTLNIYPYWAYYSQQQNNYPTNNLDLITNFDAEIKSQDYVKYVEFPENLAVGYYLVQIYNSEEVSQAYLQVSDLVASYQGTKENSIIWAHDLTTAKPLDDAEITFSHDEEFSEQTNSKGLAEFFSPSQIVNDDAYYNELVNFFYYTVASGDQKLLIPVEYHYEFGSWNFGASASRDYWTYLYTNRNLYSPSDSIKFWGVLKDRGGDQISAVKAQFVQGANYYANSEEVIIEEIDMEISSYGTYEGKFDFNNLNSGGYYLRILVGDLQISNKWIDISSYTKPSYKIEVATDKKAYFEGENVVYNIKTIYYDGTPLGNLELEYTGQLGTGLVTTDDNGQASISLATTYSNASYYPEMAYFSIHPTQAEITDIYTDAYVYLFGPAIDLEVEMDEEYAITGNVFEIDLSIINEEGADFAWEFAGDPVSGQVVSAKIYHEYYTKTETGTRYDFINKKTYKTYDYNHNSDLIDEKQATSDVEGNFDINFIYENDKNYKIEFSVTDAKNRPAVKYVYKHSGYDGYDYFGSQGYDSYNLVAEASSNDNSVSIFKPGETVNISFYKNEDLLPTTTNDDFLYFKGMVEIFDIVTENEPSYSFEFKDTYVPNIYLYGVYFDGRSYHLTQSLRLDYDSQQKKLNIDVDQDKENYKPGEEVNMTIRVTDAADNPVKAEVNVSAIDEALTAIQWDDSSNFLESLYVKLPHTLEFAYQSHKEALAPMAEGGGCFTANTQILMADGNYKDIADVRVGDEVLTKSSETSAELSSAKVTNTLEHLVNGYLVINDRLQVTPEHIVYLNGRWTAASQAKVGDYLLDAQNNKVLINSITRKTIPSKVYNLHIANFHTFIANDIYVHNNKDGSRDDFQDIAYFGSVETNNQGKASLSFKLPDNITSWLTTVHAITEDLKVESTQTGVIATLPFFLDVAVAENYVIGDQPVVKVRSLGVGLDTDANVEYTITYPDYNNEETKTTVKGNEPMEVTLPEFVAGEYSIRVDAKQGANEDSVTKKFIFQESNLLEGNSSFLALAKDMKIPGSETGYTDLTLLNNERGQYYNQLQWLTWSFGDRLEQKISRQYAEKYLMDYFDEAMSGDNDFAFDAFQQNDGGLSLLPYSSSDILLSAKALEIAGDKFDQEAARQYFETKLDSKDSNLDEIVYSLLGLANLGEPVLTEINILMENNEIPAALKIYLARALSNLGATEYATTILQTILDDYGDETDNYIKVGLGEDQDEYTEYTYQTAIILAQASSDKASKLYSYAINNPAREQLNNLEQLAYMKYALPLLSSEPVSFSYTLDDSTKEVSLAKNDKLSLSLNKDQLENISFNDIVGNVGLIASYQTPLQLVDLVVDPKLSITRQYSVDGTPTVDFQTNDLVKVTLTPTINNEAIDNEYQLTDYLPAGLKILTNLRSRYIGMENEARYPYEVDGQAVKFWTSKTNAPFYYYAIVVSKGSFIAESPVLQGFVAKDSINYGVQSAINIE